MGGICNTHEWKRNAYKFWQKNLREGLIQKFSRKRDNNIKMDLGKIGRGSID
jgi:hypothetical protein